MELPRQNFLLGLYPRNHDTKYNGLYVGIIDSNKSRYGVNGIVLVPTYADDNVKNDEGGKNITFTEENIIVYNVIDNIFQESGRREFTYEQLMIGFKDDLPVLFVEETNEVLWILPKFVWEFFEIKTHTSYILNISNNRLCINCIELRNTLNCVPKNIWSSELNPIKNTSTFIPEGCNINDVHKLPDRTSKFHIYDSDDPKEQLEKTYITYLGNKYYLKDCLVTTEKDKVILRSNNHTNIITTLGYCEIKSSQLNT